MPEKDIRKEQIAKLKEEIASVDKLVSGDVDRLQTKYGLSRKTVRTIVAKSGKYEQEVTAKAPEMEAPESTSSAAHNDLVTSSGRDTQYGALQPPANAGIGCFQLLILMSVVLFIIAAGVSVIRENL